MQKISANYLHKKMPPIHDMSSDGANQQWYVNQIDQYSGVFGIGAWFVHCYRTVWSVWRTLLEETDKLAKAKLAIVEVFQQQIADDAKVVRANKMQLAKKVSRPISIVWFQVLSRWFRRWFPASILLFLTYQRHKSGFRNSFGFFLCEICVRTCMKNG